MTRKANRSPRIHENDILLNSREQVEHVAALLKKAGMTIPPAAMLTLRIEFTDRETARDAMDIIEENRKAVAQDLEQMINRLRDCALAQGGDSIGRAFLGGIREIEKEATEHGYTVRRLATGKYAVRS